jgi:TonB-linked SusC/RagA family outer membrane protein
MEWGQDAGLNKIIKSMAKVRKKILPAVIFVLFAAFFAQTATAADLKGTVIDGRTHEPVIGATVATADGRTGTATDADGRFRIVLTSLPAVIQISFLGYNTREVEVYDVSEPVTVELSETGNFLDEVVVVGYGSQRRRELTGATATMPAAALDQPATSIDRLLGGAVAGLNVQASSGAPGAPSRVRIRGGNSINAGNEPLYVIDGFLYYSDPSNNSAGVENIEGELNPLAAINPADIESVEVLKDISATAIYGSRGANGVIIITTKRGTRGRNSVSYQFSSGTEQVSRQLSLMNASQWARVQNEYDYNWFSDDEIAAFGSGSDWQDAMFRKAASQNHQISFGGGDTATQYRVAGGYSRQEGVIINTDYERFTARFNFDRRIIEGLTFNLAATATKSTQNGLSTDAANPTYKGSISNPLRYALRNSPAVAIYNADGSFNYRNPYEKSNDLTRNGVNPNPVADMYSNTAENAVSSLLGNTFVQYQPVAGLTVKAAFGTNINHTTQSFFAPRTSLIGLIPEGKGGVGNKRYESHQQEYTATYSRQAGESHFISLLAGYTAQTTRIRYSTIETARFSREDQGVDNLYDGNQPGFPATGGTNASLRSALARANYSFRERYHLTATFRADESSRFAPGHRWGYFPSVGLSWNAVDGKATDRLNSLKVRLSAGTVGNQEIADGLWAANYTAEKSSQNGEPVTVYTRARLGNSDLKWETTTQYNVGLDAALLAGRLTVAADVYHKRTSDLLYNTPLDAGTGFRYQMQNVGSVENRGVELSIDFRPVERHEFSLQIGANVARNINRITDLGSVSRILSGNSYGNAGSSETILQVGNSLGTFFGLVFDGVVQPNEDVAALPVVSWMARQPQPGDPKYVDVNRDGRIDADDRQTLGSIQPDITGGLFLSARWRRFDFYTALQGSAGGKVYNQLRRELETADGTHNFSTSLLDAYTDEHPSTTIPRISREITYAYLDSRFVEDASFLRLKDVTVGYTLPIDIRHREIESIRLRLFLSAQNLLTVSRYSGYDPEVASGVDLGVYPHSRTFLVGGSISF